VSQVLSHVKTSIERMPACLAEPQQVYENEGRLEPVSAQGLLKELESSYAMAEEHQVHRSGRAGAAVPAAAASPTEVTYF
jgi:methyl-accepting chemotaxis protein